MHVVQQPRSLDLQMNKKAVLSQRWPRDAPCPKILYKRKISRRLRNNLHVI